MDEICSICLDEINENKNKLVTECNHTFHTNCYLSNMKKCPNNKCPNCRNANVAVPKKVLEPLNVIDTDFKVGSLVIYTLKNYKRILCTITNINRMSITICMNKLTPRKRYVTDYSEYNRYYVRNLDRLEIFRGFNESEECGFISEIYNYNTRR